MEFFSEQGKDLHEECSTLILPALSIGNVGQLAVDLLISSTRAERIGYLDDPNVLPCVGNDAYWPIPKGNLALPLEAYESSSNAMTLLQQRSPVVKELMETSMGIRGISDCNAVINGIPSFDEYPCFTGCHVLILLPRHLNVYQGMMIEFAKNVAGFSAANGKKHAVILSGLDFGRWQTIDMSSGSQIYYLSSATMDGSDDKCERLGWKRLQEYNPAQRGWEYLSTLAKENGNLDDDLPFDDELGDEDYYPSLPFASLFTCLKGKGVNVTCLFCYCSEGDNIPDAFNLAEAASKLLGLNPSNFHGNEGGMWTVPFSWRTVYGPPPDMSLF